LFSLANLGFSLFERAWTLAGMENLLMAMVDDKPFAHRLLDRILEFNLRVIDNACRFPLDAMMFGDDWGQQRGLIMGPALWREFIKPRIRQMYGAVKAHGKKVFIHSCGKVDSIFPDLIECGLDVFNPFQPEVIDVFEVKKQFGDSLSFFGGISTQRTLPFGTVDEVREEVQRLVEIVGDARGIPRTAAAEFFEVVGATVSVQVCIDMLADLRHYVLFHSEYAALMEADSFALADTVAENGNHRKQAGEGDKAESVD